MTSMDASGTKPQSRFSRTFHLSAIILPIVCFLIGTILQAIFTSPAHGQRPDNAAGPPATAGPQAPSAPKKMQVMAVVNGEQITREALAHECRRRYGQEVLESMVNKQIILQACQARGVNITNQDVENEIANVAKNFGLSVDRWLDLLETERDVKPQQYRADIIWPTIALRRLAAKQITVSEEEINKAFQSEYGPKVKARMIAVTSKQKAEQLLQALQAKPDSFAQLAKEHSEDKPTASAYGVIPPIRKHMGDANLERVAFGLKEGEVSPIVQIGNQYIILLCEKQIPRTYIAGPQLAEIQKQLERRIRDHKMRSESAEVFKQLQGQSQVVNILNDAEKQKQFPGIAATVNRARISLLQLSEECIARHGQEVLEGEINRRILMQELRRRKTGVDNPDINQEVARAAEAYGYVKPDGSPDIDTWLKEVTQGDTTTIELYVRDAVWPSVALKKLVSHKVQVTQDDLQKGFESNFGERVEVLAIVMSNQRQAQTVWDMARNNPTDQYFGNLAHEYSIEPSSRANFGKVPPIRRHSGQPSVEEEAFKLKTGELSGIVAVADKFLIMRCLGRTKPVVKEFNLVKDELAKDIHEKKLRLEMAKEFDRLKDSSQIDNFLANTSQSGKSFTSPKMATPASFDRTVPRNAPTIKR